MRLQLALPTLALPVLAFGLIAGAALAEPATPSAAPAAAPADAPISTANTSTPPPPAPGQTPALLTSPPDSLDGWLPYQGDDKKMHGQVSVGFDSRGGHYYSGSVEGPIGDNTWLGLSVSQSKWRW
ncbi:MAG TPA: hypothetical protein VG407_05445 [Caulobacteraceae bacterium]|nr:hypothetical protein [Caulobacteraceae bacterium]